MWKNFDYFTLSIRLYLSLSVNLTSHISDFVDFIQLQISNARTKYYEFYLFILKHLIIQLTKLQVCILNLSTTFRHCRTIPITFELGCTSSSIAETNRNCAVDIYTNVISCQKVFA